MSRTGEGVTIRSFRQAFEVERRIHKIDRWRIPLPYGLPLRSLGYGLGALAAILVLGQAPLVGAAVDLLPWPVRLLVVPAGVAQLLTQVDVDGRPAHEFLVAWIRWRLSARRFIAFEPRHTRREVRMDPVTVVPDDRGADYRRGSIVGAGAVILRRPARLRARGRRLHVQPTEGGPQFTAKKVALKPRQHVVIT